MTVIVTRDVSPRFRGFLASCLLEIAPGVYTAPRLSKSVRERVWTVLEDWFSGQPQGSVVMTWLDPSQIGGQGIKTLGLPAQDLVDCQGLFLARKDLPADSPGNPEAL